MKTYKTLNIFAFCKNGWYLLFSSWLQNSSLCLKGSWGYNTMSELIICNGRWLNQFFIWKVNLDIIWWSIKFWKRDLWTSFYRRLHSTRLLQLRWLLYLWFINTVMLLNWLVCWVFMTLIFIVWIIIWVHLRWWFSINYFLRYKWLG